MRALFERGRIGVGRRMMERAQRRIEVHQAEPLDERRRRQVDHPAAAQLAVDELAQCRLGEAGGARVDRREAVGQRLILAHHAQARMDHLSAEESLAHFAEDAQPGARASCFWRLG